jgi:hypothetical protein
MEPIGAFAVFFGVTLVASALILGEVVPHVVGIGGWFIAVYFIIYATTGSPPLIGGEPLKAGGEAIDAAYGSAGLLGALAGAGSAIFLKSRASE